MSELLREIDVLILYIDELVPQVRATVCAVLQRVTDTLQLPYLAPHLDVIIPELSKTARYTQYLIF